MTITYGLMEKIEEIAENSDKARIMLKTKVTKLLTDSSGNICGVEAVTKDGKTFQEHGPVIIATGGFGADFADIQILSNAQVAVYLQVSARSADNRDEELHDVYRKTQKYVDRFNTMNNKEKNFQELVDELDNLQE